MSEFHGIYLKTNQQYAMSYERWLEYNLEDAVERTAKLEAALRRESDGLDQESKCTRCGRVFNGFDSDSCLGDMPHQWEPPITRTPIGTTWEGAPRYERSELSRNIGTFPKRKGKKFN